MKIKRGRYNCYKRYRVRKIGGRRVSRRYNKFSNVV